MKNRVYNIAAFLGALLAVVIVQPTGAAVGAPATQPAVVSTAAAATQPPATTRAGPAEPFVDDGGDSGIGGKPTTGPAKTADAFPGDDAASTTTSAAGSPELMLFKDIPVVVAAGMRAQTQDQAAASVSVVSANDIELFNYRSLADVLHGQRSFYLDNDGLNWFAGVRGFQRPGEWNARILVLEDGRPTNELIYGQSNLDQDFPLPMEAVKQVEVIRGPGSALYGSGAVFGVINQVTKDGADVNGIELKGEGGSGSTGHVNLLMGRKFDSGIDVIADFTGYTSQGDNDIIFDGVTDAAHDYGHIRNSDYEGVYAGFVKARWGDLTLQGDTSSRKRDDADATGLTSWYNPGTMYERRTNVTLRLNHNIGQDQNLQAMVYYGHYHYQQQFPYDLTEAPAPVSYFSAGEDDFIGEQIHYGWQVNKGLHLLAGVDATQSLHTLQHDENSLTGPAVHVSATYNSVGLFFEDEIKPASWLSVTTGVRFDQVQRVGSTVSPRAAVIATPSKVDTFKFMYGRAFRDPNLYELLYTSPPPDGTVQNLGLKPEIVDTFEISYDRQLGHGWSGTLDGYLWKMSNSMENYTYPDGSLQIRNSGTVWAQGVEGELDRRFQNGGSFRLYASYTRAEEYGASLTHSPNWIVGSSIALPVLKNCFISIEPQIVAPMRSDLYGSTSTTFVTNVVFTSREFAKGWTFQAGVYNLFAGKARLPADGSFDQVQSKLDYPETKFMASIEKRF